MNFKNNRYTRAAHGKRVAAILFFITIQIGLFVSIAYPQTKTPLQFQSYPIEAGLSQGFVSSMVQDKTGLMWFATGDGLNKYDGYKFTVYHHDPNDVSSLGNDDLTCIFEDSRGLLWIGLRNNGLDVFDRENNRFYHIRRQNKNGLRSDNVLGLAEDKTGALWVRTREGIDRMEIYRRPSARHDAGHYVFSKKYALTFLHIHFDNITESTKKLNRYGAEDLFIDSKGRILIITSNTIWEFIKKPDKKIRYRLKLQFKFSPVEENFIPAIIEDTLHHALLLNYKKIVKFPNGDFSNPRFIYKYNPSGIAWVVDKKANLWLADEDRLTQINLNNGTRRNAFSNDGSQKKALQAITNFYKDRSGLIWISTGGYGILKYDPDIEIFHHLLNGINHYQLIGDKSGYIFTNNFDSIKIKNTGPVQITRFVDRITLKRHFPKTGAITMGMDSRGILWTGINGRIIRYDKRTKNIKQFRLPFTGTITQPFPVFVDDHDDIWMGYNKYFVRYRPLTGHFTRYAYPQNESKSYDYDFLQNIQQDGRLLWLGSTNGLFCFDMDSAKIIKSYYHSEQDKKSISSNFIYSFCKDPIQPKQYLWIGTKGGGLNRLDRNTGKFLHFDTRDGLANNVIYGILSDKTGNLWLSTNHGLSRFNTTTGSFRNFDVSDGLQGNEFNRYAYCKIADSLLVFGGLNGINYFNPKDIKTLPPPKVILTDLRLFNKSVQPGKAGSVLTKSIGFTKGIELQYKQNVLTFEFAAADYRNPDNIEYRYKLEGFDKDFIYLKHQHEATYTNLNSGTYHFIVQADFEDGVWGTKYTSLELVIIPPWWNTWWFYSIVTILSVSAVYSVYRYRVNQLMKVSRLRNRIARDLHDEIGSSISTIAIYAKIVQEHMKKSHFDNESLVDKITENASEIMESMNDIVWNIHTKNDRFDSIISRMREHAYQLFEAKGYTLHFDFDENLSRKSLPMEVRRDLYLIYKEALNNVAKYANGKNVWILLFTDNNMITLMIKDDGVGFNPADIKKSSNGLANMNYRAENLKGNLKVVSRPGHGTEIDLTFRHY